jgi:localization factor PodJL
MAADLAWNIESIPETAREQAVRSARREGIPIGEWMTRQIFEGLADSEGNDESNPSLAQERMQRSAALGHTDEPERNGDAVHRLQRELGRLGKDINGTVRRSDAHVWALDDKLEELTQDFARLRAEASNASTGLEERLTQTAGQLTVQLSGLASKLESLAAELRNEHARASGAATAVEQRITHAEHTVQALAAHRDDTARTIAAALEALLRQFDGAKDLTSRLEQRLGVVEHSLDWLGTVHKNEVHELSARISAVDGRFDDVSRGAQNNANRVQVLMASLQTEFGQLADRQQQESQSRSEAIATVDTRLEQLRSRADDGQRAIDSQLGEVQQYLTDLSQRQDQAATDAAVKFSHLDADVAAKLESTIRLLTLQQQTAFGALATRHGDLENTLKSGLDEINHRAAQTVESHNARHAALEASIAEMKNRQAENDRSAADRIAALDGRLAELAARHAETHRSVADQIADLSSRLGELHGSGSRAAESADQRIEGLKQLASELDRRHADRSDALAREVRNLTDRLASSEERFVDKAHHGEFAAELSGKIEALENLVTAVDGNVADVNRVHAESERSVADQVAAVITRLDEIQRSASGASDSAQQRIENLRQLADELDRRNTDRHQALAREVQNLIERLARSEERFVDKARHGEIAAELAGKLDALEHLVKAAGGNVADINRAHAESDRTVADRIADFAARIDDLQLSTSHTAAAAKQRFETLEQRADDRENRNDDRIQALMHDVQSAIDKLASSEERFAEASERQQSSVAELAEKFRQRQNLDESQADIAQRANQEIAELRRDIGAKLALLEPPLANLQHIVQQSDVRHETQERLLGEKLEYLAGRLAQIDAGIERRLGAAQDEVDRWHDNYMALQVHEAAIQSHADKLADLAELRVGTAVDDDRPPSISVQADPGRMFDPVDIHAEQEAAHPFETAPETITEGETAPTVDGPDRVSAGMPDAADDAAPDFDDFDGPVDLQTDAAGSAETLQEVPPFPELPPPGAGEIDRDAVHDAPAGLASQEDQKPADNPETDANTRSSDTAPAATPPSFISQARQAAQLAAQGREALGGKGVQKTRLSVIAAVTVIVLSVAGARLWLARTSAPAPRASATGNTHVLKHVKQAISAPSRSASAVANRPATAADPLLARAGAGDVRAQLLLGVRAFEAPPSPQSDKNAVTWLSSAAKQGDPIAQCYLAMLYQKGRGVAADARQAYNLYSAAASAGNRLAMNNLAVAYAQGAGVNKDVRQAALWFSEAADRGLIEAQFDLAVLYERGLGVPQSLGDAYRWYTIAAHAGDSESKARAEAIATELSPAERAAADQDAAQFKPLGVSERANALPRDTE